MTKTLPQMLNDLLGLSQLMIEQAAQVQELVAFFGGVSGVPVPLPSFSLVPAAPPLRAHAAVSGETPINDLTVASGVPRRKMGRPPGSKNKSRPLTKEEKAAIRTDWESFLPHQRTTVNRLALAAKYRVTGLHVFALTRPDPPLKKYFQRIGGTPAQQSL